MACCTIAVATEMCVASTISRSSFSQPWPKAILSATPSGSCRSSRRMILSRTATRCDSGAKDDREENSKALEGLGSTLMQSLGSARSHEPPQEGVSLSSSLARNMGEDQAFINKSLALLGVLASIAAPLSARLASAVASSEACNCFVNWATLTLVL
eukprot:jgi/Mesen1/10392/ME000081S09778